MTAPEPAERTSTYSSRFLVRFGVFAIASSIMLLPFVFTAAGPSSLVWYVVIRAVATISAFGATVLLVFDWMMNRRFADQSNPSTDEQER